MWLFHKLCETLLYFFCFNFKSGKTSTIILYYITTSSIFVFLSVARLLRIPLTEMKWAFGIDQ